MSANTSLPHNHGQPGLRRAPFIQKDFANPPPFPKNPMATGAVDGYNQQMNQWWNSVQSALNEMSNELARLSLK